MISDTNKNIISITYNHLNLPTKIFFGNGNSISYLYTANGQKVQKTVQNNNPITVDKTDYLGGFQYFNELLRFFPHAEGYVNATKNKYDYDFNYVFNYTDHLGNIRLSYTQDPISQVLKVTEENHYYPFGLKHTGYNSDVLLYAKEVFAQAQGQTELFFTKIKPKQSKDLPVYNYKYNGQEWQDELGLNWYTYRYRNYDPAIGRFMGIDPISEEYYTITNYQFAHNNPIWKIEIEGLEGAPSNSVKDILNNEPVFLNKNIILSASDINSQKERHSRDGVSTFRFGISYKDNYSKTIGVKNVDCEGNVSTINLSLGMAVGIDGESIEYNAVVGQLDGSVNANGESLADGYVSLITINGSYNPKNKENISEVNLFSNQVNSIFGNKENNTVEDLVLELSVVGGYIEANATELGNNIQDLGNLVTSWFEAILRENFDVDNSGVNPILD